MYVYVSLRVGVSLGLWGWTIFVCLIGGRRSMSGFGVRCVDGVICT